MICNIIDRRKRPYRWKKVTAIFEPTWHDNSCIDADQCEKGPGEEGIGYEEFVSITVFSALASAEARKYWVTVFLYDQGEGILEVT